MEVLGYIMGVLAFIAAAVFGAKKYGEMQTINAANAAGEKELAKREANKKTRAHTTALQTVQIQNQVTEANGKLDRELEGNLKVLTPDAAVAFSKRILTPVGGTRKE
jgi:hypothetical protein